jgi:hypothetical protein
LPAQSGILREILRWRFRLLVGGLSFTFEFCNPRLQRLQILMVQSLAPWAVVSSMPFAPEIAIPSVKYMNDRLKLRVNIAGKTVYQKRCSAADKRCVLRTSCVA